MRSLTPITFLCLGFSLVRAQAPPTIDQALVHLGLSKDRLSLYKALRDSRADVRSVAAAEMHDVEAIPMIAGAMAKEPDRQVRFNMAQDLNVLGSPDGTHKLESSCADLRESFETRMHAAIDLSNTGNYECLPFVSDILHSPEPTLRESVLLYLNQISSAPRIFPPSVGAALLHVARREADPKMRSLAAKVIFQIGDRDTKDRFLRDTKK